MNRFLLSLIILTTVLLAATYAGAQYHYFELPTFTWLIEISLAIVTATIFYFLDRRPPGMGFTQIYLFSIVTKICLFGILMTLVILLDKPNASGNVVLFMTSYVLFTTLEVVVLFRKING